MVTNEKMDEFLRELNADELWKLYGVLNQELRTRGKARTGNLTSERGESVAIDVYRNTPGEPKLQLALTGTKNIDAVSREGKSYSIKTLRSSRTTGTFQSDDFKEKKFDYLILVVLDKYYQPSEVLEAPWKSVNRYKKYHKVMKAYNISLTKAFRKECRIVLGYDQR